MIRKHDFVVEDGAVKFEFKGKKYSLRGYDFIKFIRDHKLEDYFENVQYHTPGFTYIVGVSDKKILKGKIRGDKQWIHVNNMPVGIIPVIKNVKPTMDNPFTEASKVQEKNSKMMKHIKLFEQFVDETLTEATKNLGQEDEEETAHNDLVNKLLDHCKDPDDAEKYASMDPDSWPEWLSAAMDKED